MELHGGDRKTESRSHDVTLNDLGISKMQSHRWQTIAAEAKERQLSQLKRGQDKPDVKNSTQRGVTGKTRDRIAEDFDVFLC